MLDAFFDELEKIARETSPRSGVGSRGGKVHHYTKSGRPVYQSEVDRKKSNSGARVAAGIAGYVGLATALPILTGLRARKANQRFWQDFGRQYGQYAGRAAGPSARSAARKAKSVIPGLGKVKTKVDAKKAYRAAALGSHPDRGGDADKMKTINAAWEDFVKSPAYEKLAMVSWASIADKLLNSDRRHYHGNL